MGLGIDDGELCCSTRPILALKLSSANKSVPETNGAAAVVVGFSWVPIIFPKGRRESETIVVLYSDKIIIYYYIGELCFSVGGWYFYVVAWWGWL